MSRIGDKPIALPPKVKARLNDGSVFVEGPKGKIQMRVLNRIEINIEKERVVLRRPSDSIEDKTNHGTMRSLLANMIKGVTEGFQRKLLIEGVGFRAQLAGKNLNMSLGYSHPVILPVPQDLQLKVATPTEILIEGSDKARVGQFAAEIRSKFEPEPYKGKGIRYSDEVVRRKAGKSVTK